MPAQLGTEQDGKGLLRIHLWYPYDLPRLWDRTENRIGLKTSVQTLASLSMCYEVFLVHAVFSSYYVFSGLLETQHT